MADPTIITSVSSVQVPEGGQATFNVRLSSRPRKRSIEINIERVSGDSSIEISSAREMAFSRRNYNQWQTVTMVAAEDGDHTDGQAVFRLSGEDVTAATIAATEARQRQRRFHL
jgi:cellulose 1,4-beta-cellobiosidase